MTRAFWDDVANDVQDPEFARAYADEAIRISAIDSLSNAQNDTADIQARRREPVSRADARRDLGLNEARKELGDGKGAEHA